MEKPVVSILCLTYNHAPYIRQALEGFVNQRTTFPYEVVVHDDCSTDGNQDIIREFEERYPDKVRAIYQSENQYSQGVDIFEKFLYPSEGVKYVACCEGDDSWFDMDKLQKSYDYMEAHPDCTVTSNQTLLVNRATGATILNTPYTESRDFTIEEVALTRSGTFATNSLFFRADVYNSYPAEFNEPNFSDYQTVLYSTACGYMHYFADCMGIYNFCTAGSSSATNMADVEYMKECNDQVMHFLGVFDKYYEGKYHDSLMHTRLVYERMNAVLAGGMKKYAPKYWKLDFERIKNRLKKLR